MEAVIRFKSPATFMLYGMTQLGKSSWVFNLLRCKDNMFEVLLQHVSTKLRSAGDSIVMHKGIHQGNFWKDMLMWNIALLSWMIYKLNAIKIDSGVGELFCVGSHALNMSILLVGHCIFGKDLGVLMNRNLHYIMLMGDWRDKRLIATLGSQLGRQIFFKAYELLTAKQFW